jgi:polyphenol oxidase
MSNLIAHWPAPENISALTTTRTTGMSVPPYNSNNLALHVGDNYEHVLNNRHALIKQLSLPDEPAWLNQTHSNRCVVVEEDRARDADASITRHPNQVLAIMTADCLPIVLCDTKGREIAAIHAGWRGLLDGIVENTLHKMQSDNHHLLAWIGPAICHQCYETGEAVREAYVHRYPFAHEAFYAHTSGLHADLPKLATLILNASGVTRVYSSNACSFERNDAFYSYRREAKTGRMATLIWFNRI